MDLNPYTKLEHYTQHSPVISAENFVPVSASNKMNIPHLSQQLYDTAIQSQLNQESTIVSNTRHYEALRQAFQRLEAVHQGLHQNITGDFLAMDIRQALHHLGEISGEVSTDGLLGNIFANF